MLSLLVHIGPFQNNISNKETTLFLGDVFYYLSRRGEANLVQEQLQTSYFHAAERYAHENKLQRDNEPLSCHESSMGGQLVYDMVTHFLPADGIKNTSDYQSIAEEDLA